MKKLTNDGNFGNLHEVMSWEEIKDSLSDDPCCRVIAPKPPKTNKEEPR